MDKDNKNNLRQMGKLHAAVVSTRPIIIFGTGEMGESVGKYLRLRRRNVSLMVDNDKQKWGKRKKGISIVPPEQAREKYPEGLYLVANTTHYDEMKQQLLGMGIPEARIILCNDFAMLQKETELYLPMERENQYFIYDTPYERTMKHALSVAEAKIKASAYKMMMDAWHPVSAAKRRYRVSVCAIFKNEADYLREWIEYHKLVGVEHFYLYNNFSEDGFMQVLRPYVDNGDVSLIDWPYPQGQIAAYRDCVRKFKTESRWIGFIDLDEFVVPVDDDNLYDFLKKFEKNRGSVLIYWKLFGTSGKTKRKRSGLVTEDFTVCWRKHTNIGKCFYNTAYDFIPDFDKNSNMIHSLWTGYQGKARPPVNCFDHVCLEGLNWTEGDHFPIQINHYFTKSLEEWNEKRRRGDAYFKQNPRNDAYFMEHDGKCGAVDVSIYKYMIPLKKRLFEGK